MPGKAPERVVVGKLSGVYGIKGWVKVYSWTDPRDNILSYKRWMLKTPNGWEERKLLQGRLQGKGLVAWLEGCSTREDAEALKGSEVAVLETDFAPLAKNQYYWRDLIGLKVVNQEGADFGSVHSLIETGANSVLVVRGERERLVPWVIDQYIKSVDLEQGLISVDWDADF
ncbi:MAG: ribosome maturation factor RimM [bacterium]